MKKKYNNVAPRAQLKETIEKLDYKIKIYHKITMLSFLKFLVLGFSLAFFEELITQGMLKNNLVTWIIPTFIAFIPYLLLVYLFGFFLEKRLNEYDWSVYNYLLSGSLGLLIEWFLIGLNPWNNVNILQIPFQFGMFSFWASVGFLPRILFNLKEEMAHLRTSLKRYIIIGYGIIYFIAFTTKQPDTRFILAIIAVILFFSSLNYFYYKYCKLLGRLKNEISPSPNDQFITHMD